MWRKSIKDYPEPHTKTNFKVNYFPRIEKTFLYSDIYSQLKSLHWSTHQVYDIFIACCCMFYKSKILCLEIMQNYGWKWLSQWGISLKLMIEFRSEMVSQSESHHTEWKKNAMECIACWLALFSNLKEKRVHSPKNVVSWPQDGMLKRFVHTVLKLRIPDSYDAKIAKFCYLWTFWPVIQLKKIFTGQNLQILQIFAIFAS